jgi:hypothetical protein
LAKSADYLIAERCTHGQVLKLTSIYFVMAASGDLFESRHDRTPAPLG